MTETPRISDESATKNAVKKTSIWGNPFASDKQDRREQHFNLRSNLLTLFLTVLIIVGGFMLPVLVYPYLDLYGENRVRLVGPSEEMISERIFEEPVTLYPWNLYNEQSLRPLTASERDFLEQKNIPAFLVATMEDHGLSVLFGENTSNTQILSAFHCLEPQSSSEPGCFILVDLDIDQDGAPDLNCAVNFDGEIISLIFVDSKWDSVEITTPIGQEPNSEGEPGTESASAELEQTTDQPQADQSSTDQPNGTASQETTEAAGIQPAVNEATEGEVAEGETTPGTGSNESPSIEPPSGEFRPVEEDENLWSFAYATSREAQVVQQHNLFTAFRQLELNYENRFSYPYVNLLGAQPSSEEYLPELEYVRLTYRDLRTGNYLLRIYDLPNGKRLVLYLNPSNLHCMGFNLLRYAMPTG